MYSATEQTKIPTTRCGYYPTTSAPNGQYKYTEHVVVRKISQY